MHIKYSDYLFSTPLALVIHLKKKVFFFKIHTDISHFLCCMLILVPQICCQRNRLDAMVLNKIYMYGQQMQHTQIYCVLFNTKLKWLLFIQQILSASMLLLVLHRQCAHPRITAAFRAYTIERPLSNRPTILVLLNRILNTGYGKMVSILYVFELRFAKFQIL